MLLKDNILWLYNFQTRMLKQKKPVAFFVFEALFLGAIIIDGFIMLGISHTC